MNLTKNPFAALLAAALMLAALLGGCEHQTTGQSMAVAGSAPQDAPPASVPAAAASGGVWDLAAEDLRGKTWLVIGDSISEHNSCATKNYHDYIAEWLGLTVINTGVAGIGYLQGYEGQPHFVYQMERWPAEEEIDFITVMGGTNDRVFPLGERGNTQRDVMYGALDEFYTALLAKYPNTPIGVITPPPMAEAWGEGSALSAHVDAIIEMAGSYSFPVLDMYRESGLRPWLAENNRLYFSTPVIPDGDGVHPNAEGQRVMAWKILPFILQHMHS